MHRDKEIEERREKTARKAQQEMYEQTRLAALIRVEDLDKVTVDMSVAELRDQLEIYHDLVAGIPLKSHLKTKAVMIEALKDAITRYGFGKNESLINQELVTREIRETKMRIKVF